MRCADCTKEKKKIKISKIFEKYNIANIMLVSQYAQHKKKIKIPKGKLFYLCDC